MPTGIVTYLRPEVADAELLLGWRTRPDIARHLFTDIEPDIERQRAWLAASRNRPGFVHRLIALDGMKVGYCSIMTTDDAARVGTFGVYLADRRARIGPAGLNFIHMLNHAFFTMGLAKIVNQIMGGNARLIRAQAHNGYRTVGVLRQQVMRHGEAQDIHLFELLRQDWIVFRERFRDYRDLDGIERPVPQPALTAAH